VSKLFDDRMPTSQGPFWSYKTFAYLVFGVVAFYKVVRMDGPIIFTGGDVICS